MQPTHKVILDHCDLLETQAIIILKTFSSLPQILEFINIQVLSLGLKVISSLTTHPPNQITSLISTLT